MKGGKEKRSRDTEVEKWTVRHIMSQRGANVLLFMMRPHSEAEEHFLSRYFVFCLLPPEEEQKKMNVCQRAHVRSAW